jgi:hypothetical protein
MFPPYPRADAMPIGLQVGLFVNDVKYNNLEPPVYYVTVELEFPVVHFL